MKVASGGRITVTKDGNTTTVDITDISGFSGTVLCKSAYSTSCNLYSMSASASGFEGVYGAGESIGGAARRRRRRLWGDEGEEGEEDRSGGQHARRRLATSLSADDKKLSNPVVCIQAQDTVMFDVSNADYPVYVKDSLLNTNPDFDFSEFIKLAEVAKSSSTVQAFGFTFTVPGTYVFRLSSDSAKITIIAVMAENVACTTTAQFTPMTQSNLAAINVKTQNDYILTPDWGLIGGLLGGLVFVIFGVISTMYYFRRKAWTIGGTTMPRYRKKTQNKKMQDLHSKGSVLKKGEASNDIEAAGTDPAGTFSKDNPMHNTGFAGALNTVKSFLGTTSPGGDGGEDLDRWDMLP
jgi:hypothetical protein